MGPVYVMNTRVEYPALPFGEVESSCVFKSETETEIQTNRQAAPLARAGGHAPVVVVVETICYDLLEVHIGELVGLWSIKDSKLSI